MFEKLEEWLFKQGRGNPFNVFPDAVEIAGNFKKLVEATKCPACEQKKLRVNKFERGPKGWEADVTCDNCKFVGLLNSTSTIFTSLSKVGKAT